MTSDNKKNIHQKKISEKLAACAVEIDEYIARFLTGSASNIWEAANHYIKAGGKRLRPFISMRCFDLARGEGGHREALPIGAAFELLHTFSLVHDDIIDGDNLRRGVQSVHDRWGVPIGILSGDILFGMTNVVICNSTLTDHIKAGVLREFGILCIDLCEGQSMDIDFEQRNDVTIDDYMHMIYLKTASFFEKCAAAGGIAGGAGSEQVASLRSYGKNMGLAFQIIDDLLDLIATTGDLGKPALSDLRSGKKTYVLIDAIDSMTAERRKIFSGLMAEKNKTADTIVSILNEISATGALERARVLSNTYITNAIASLSGFPNTEARRDLEAIARLTVERGS